MQKFSIVFNSSSSVIINSCRYLRFLRKEYLGEYLPKVDEKHLESHRTSRFTKYSDIDKHEKYEISEEVPDANYHKDYPELFNYLPFPHLRDSLRERIERREMMKRRRHLEIPEFYAGCIMAISTADPFMSSSTSSSKLNRFVGLCIQKRVAGLLSSVRLRNVIDKIGIEMEYELYNPTVVAIEVLKFEKRLDDNLLYLRDAPAHYSTVALNMTAEPRTAGLSVVPINELKVAMNPRPWSADWHHHNYRGIQDEGWNQEDGRPLAYIQDSRTEIGRYDLMGIYRDRGSYGDRNKAMRHVEVLHQDLIKYQKERYAEEMAALRRSSGGAGAGGAGAGAGAAGRTGTGSNKRGTD